MCAHVGVELCYCVVFRTCVGLTPGHLRLWGAFSLLMPELLRRRGYVLVETRCRGRGCEQTAVHDIHGEVSGSRPRVMSEAALFPITSVVQEDTDAGKRRTTG